MPARRSLAGRVARSGVRLAGSGASLPAEPGMPRQSEKRFQAQVVAMAKLLGWRCYWAWNSQHSPKGWPDLVLIRRPRIVFLELKGERTPVSDEQRQTIAELQACGLTAMIARPSDWPEIERILAR